MLPYLERVAEENGHNPGQTLRKAEFGAAMQISEWLEQGRIIKVPSSASVLMSCVATIPLCFPVLVAPGLTDDEVLIQLRAIREANSIDFDDIV